MGQKPSKSLRTPRDLADYIESEAERTGQTETDVMVQLLRDGKRYRQHIHEVDADLERIQRQLQKIQNDSSGGLFG
jgi:polyhydroxyalkanoate synthesis regulator phasin